MQYTGYKIRYTTPMHIYFSGIGGAGIGPIALIAREAGYDVSGSDKQDSQYVEYLRSKGITDVHIGQDEAAIAAVHQASPIDWLVYSSAVEKENSEHPELQFANSHGIRRSKRDEFLNHFLGEKKLKLIAVAGTHGKTTTTAMVAWLFHELQVPVSHLVPAKISFGETGHFDPAGQYFIYECDEFDRNFLAFHPYISLISGVAWDHHEIYKSAEEYNQAFRDFLNQSEHRIIWQEDYCDLDINDEDGYSVLNMTDEGFTELKLKGNVNRRNAWLAIEAASELTKEPLDKLIGIMNEFPGLSRRMEEIRHNLYSDYAHTPEKIKGAMQTALEMAKENSQKVVVVYEPLTNRRAHFTKEQHADVFNGADNIYWVPSYLAREDPDQSVLTPAELIKYLNPDQKLVAMPMELDDELKETIQKHLDSDDMVVAMSGGGGHSLDEWLRENFS